MATHRLIESSIHKRLLIVNLFVNDAHPLIVRIILPHDIFGILNAIVALQAFSHILVQSTATTIGFAAILHTNRHTQVVHYECHGVAFFYGVLRIVGLEHCVPVVLALFEVCTYLCARHIVGRIIDGAAADAMLRCTMIAKHLSCRRSGASRQCACAVGGSRAEVVVWLILSPTSLAKSCYRLGIAIPTRHLVHKSHFGRLCT